MHLRDVINFEVTKTTPNAGLGNMVGLPVEFPKVAGRWMNELGPSVDIYLMSLTGIPAGSQIEWLPSTTYEQIIEFIEEDYPAAEMHHKILMWFLISDKLLGYVEDKIRLMEIECLKQGN